MGLSILCGPAHPDANFDRDAEASVRARSLNGGTRNPSVAAASEPRVAVTRKQ